MLIRWSILPFFSYSILFDIERAYNAVGTDNIAGASMLSSWINPKDIKKIHKVGDGSFAKVYKAEYVV